MEREREQNRIKAYQEMSEGHQLRYDDPTGVNLSELIRLTRDGIQSPDWEVYAERKIGDGVRILKKFTYDNPVSVISMEAGQIKESSYDLEDGKRVLGEGVLRVEDQVESYRIYTSGVAMVRYDQNGNPTGVGTLTLANDFKQAYERLHPPVPGQASDEAIELEEVDEPARHGKRRKKLISRRAVPTDPKPADTAPVAVPQGEAEPTNPVIESLGRIEDLVTQGQRETGERLNDIDGRVRDLEEGQDAKIERAVAAAALASSVTSERRMTPSEYYDPGTPLAGEPDYDWGMLETGAAIPDASPTVVPSADVPAVTEEPDEPSVPVLDPVPAAAVAVAAGARAGEEDRAGSLTPGTSPAVIPGTTPSQGAYPKGYKNGNGTNGYSSLFGSGHSTMHWENFNGAQPKPYTNGVEQAEEIEAAAEEVNPVASLIEVHDLSEDEPKKVLEIRPDSDEEYHLPGNEKRVFGFAKRVKPRNKGEDEQFIDVDQDIVGVTLDRAGFYVLDGYRKNKGGRRAAEIAAKVIAQKLSELPIRSNMTLSEYQEKLKEALIEANTSVRESKSLYPDFAQMRTTAAIARIVMKGTRSYVVTASVGDSRISVVRKPKEGGNPLNPLTEDSEQLLGDEAIDPKTTDPWILNKRDRTYYYTNGVHRHFNDRELAAITQGKQIKRRKGGLHSVLDDPFGSLADLDEDAALMISTYD